MLHANPKTRRQNQTAGESVDVEGYLRKMADNATDGDHLTLQVRFSGLVLWWWWSGVEWDDWWTSLFCLGDPRLTYTYLPIYLPIDLCQQALCDALQCPVHVVQLVDSPLADKASARWRWLIDMGVWGRGYMQRVKGWLST